jgi:hypothetical protein
MWQMKVEVVVRIQVSFHTVLLVIAEFETISLSNMCFTITSLPVSHWWTPPTPRFRRTASEVRVRAVTQRLCQLMSTRAEKQSNVPRQGPLRRRVLCNMKSTASLRVCT